MVFATNNILSSFRNTSSSRIVKKPKLLISYFCLSPKIPSLQFIIHHIETIISEYEGHPPLSIYLKEYFKKHGKLGSRDRKAISEAAYIYYRCAAFQPDESMSVAELIKQGMLWCNSEQEFLKKVLKDISLPTVMPTTDDYPLQTSLSYGLDSKIWLESILRQPQLFIRARVDSGEVCAALEQNKIPFRQLATPINGNNCIALPNGAKIDQVLPERYYAVQDYSSQQSLQIAVEKVGRDFFQQKMVVWDVCSGAGGKTLLFKDMFPDIRVVATDVRERILHNLRVRMRQAGITGVSTICLNAANRHELDRNMPHQNFDFIICDVPCSGSGTWARTPEQFYFFDHQEVADFAAIQFDIAANALQRLNHGGYMAYITCSVFMEENEAVTDRLKASFDVTLVHRQLIDGINVGADCMFIAIFKKK